ncbi:unnamed protein product [Protopolystoma xenopodis]|uniref:Uncharacterized protein n=1 Tax=Protopolystoma xenopodis TaxID=117903 RepID=A0A448WF26_9PLAT|nr:unnamed protein product [Protopolystoma xenopodis]
MDRRSSSPEDDVSDEPEATIFGNADDIRHIPPSTDDAPTPLSEMELARLQAERNKVAAQLAILTNRYTTFRAELDGPAIRRLEAIISLESELVRQKRKLLDQSASTEEEEDAATTGRLVICSALQASWRGLERSSRARGCRLDVAAKFISFHHEYECLVSWLVAKTRLLASTDELDLDLTGVVHLQRRLLGWPADLARLYSRLDKAQETAARLKHCLRREAGPRRDLRLASSEWRAADQDLDEIQLWLRRMQRIAASTDTRPQNLLDAQRTLGEHQQLWAEIMARQTEFNRLLSCGRQVVSERPLYKQPSKAAVTTTIQDTEMGNKTQEELGDSQELDEANKPYADLNDRLNSLEEGWTELGRIWQDRQEALQLNHAYQVSLVAVRASEF